MQNSVISTRITSLQGSQTSPVVLCMQNNVISIRITSLYGYQPSFVIFACKTASLGPELRVSMGPRPHLCFFCIQNGDFSTRIAGLYGWQPSSVVFAGKTASFWSELQVSMVCRPHLSYCACKTTWLVWELLVSMGPSPHLWILHAKQRLLDLIYKSLWVPDFACWFVNAKRRA